MPHKINYDLFRQMHPENLAPLCEYVNVKINDEYYGLFILMERLDQNRLKVNKKDPGAIVFKEPPIFHQIMPENFLNEENYFNQRYPKINKEDKKYEMNFLLNASDIEFQSKIANWIDLRNVLDWHLLLLFSNNGDALVKNFYLYKKKNFAPFRIAIWDCDHTFGRDCDGEKNMMEREIDFNESILFQRLLKWGSYKKKLQERWIELRNEKIFSEKNLNRMINENDKKIKNHVTRNFEKWPLNHSYYFDNNSYDQELELMREFISKRIPFLDKYFSSPYFLRDAYSTQ
jgi:hypothetical protein